ncbi:MAG: flagellar hook assembly protein FlgD, partial [Gammaproteobacteria bacterium]|nr:flagellar hook assembly protein FlgD [Gammaproteobacteria bacterium]
MTTTSPLGELGAFAPPPPQKRNDELGQEDFLTLMITQFKNQDPFKPMENGEFLGQIAQFSTVSGIDSLNSSFAGLATSIQGEQALQAANLVGHSVLAVTDVAYLPEGGQVNGVVELDASASDVQIDIVDGSGELLQTLSLGQQPAGMTRFSWDGTDAAGETVAPGHYQIKARVVRGTQVESAATAIEADIESVTLGQYGGGMLLN